MKTDFTYWGVICRGCFAPVVFGAPYHSQFKAESSYARPGAIRCGNGHTYIYFPRDFKFFSLTEEITDAVMQANHDAHRAVNPVVEPRSEHWSGTRWAPEGEVAAAETSSSGSGDPRREMARIAGKSIWSDWAAKKLS